MTSKLKLLVATGLASAALMNASSAYAAGTLQNTDITNTVSVAYNVGGVAQTPVSSNTDTFKVDRRVNFTVAELAPVGSTLVSPGQSGAITRFTVTNTSNDTLDFDLTALNSTAKRGTDAFDLTGLTAYVDVNGNGIRDAADTATFINDLAPDATVNIIIVGNVPINATNGQYAGVRLTATARDSAGGALTNSTGANGKTTVETVFADSGNDGIEFDNDDYLVQTATLTAYKTSRVVSDPTNGTSNPKAIPGAVVEYCISVVNGGSVSATNVTISDVVPTNTSYVTNSLLVAPTITSPGATQTCTAGTTGGSYSGGANGTASYTAATLAASGTTGIVFQVTIN